MLGNKNYDADASCKMVRVLRHLPVKYIERKHYLWTYSRAYPHVRK